MTTEKKCCEKCKYIGLPEAWWKPHSNCPCHTPQTGDWEEHFYKSFTRNYIPDGSMKYIELRGSEVEHLKSFISQIEAEARAKGREEAVEHIKKRAFQDTLSIGSLPQEFRAETFYVVSDKTIKQALQTPPNN